MAKKKMSTIAFEGVIGVGKSTICKKLKENEPSEITVLQEGIDRPFLNLFYQNPKKYGFAFQMVMLTQRIYQGNIARLKKLYEHSETICLWDRSTIGDYIFAIWNYMTGSIEKNEMLVYQEKLLNGQREEICQHSITKHIQFIDETDLFILLDDEPEKCMQRVIKERGNDEEKGIPLEYYEGIDDVHFHIFIKLFSNGVRQTKFSVVRWGDYDNEKLFWLNLQRRISGDSNSDIHEAKITYVKTLPKGMTSFKLTNERGSILDPYFNPLNHKLTILYEAEEDILNQYNIIIGKSNHSLSKSETIPTNQKQPNIYIPSNIMIVDKPIVNKIENFIFYKNEFKRVVLFHLSLGHNLFFYEKIGQ
jgi:deoxyadenosine/deoxycytidine kinase